MSAFDKEHMMRARNLAAELGMEVTLEELYEIKEKAFQNLREIIEEEGLLIPESDEDLLKLIAIIVRNCTMSSEMMTLMRRGKL